MPGYPRRKTSACHRGHFLLDALVMKKKKKHSESGMNIIEVIFIYFFFLQHVNFYRVERERSQRM